ncbi:MAG: hypothetical protein WKF54_08335 [Nocardioidaceae bacterium]
MTSGSDGRLAFFDLDDTLVDRQRAFAAWLDEFAARWHLHAEARRTLAAADHGGLAPRESLLGSRSSSA